MIDPIPHGQHVCVCGHEERHHSQIQPIDHDYQIRTPCRYCACEEFNSEILY